MATWIFFFLFFCRINFKINFAPIYILIFGKASVCGTLTWSLHRETLKFHWPMQEITTHLKAHVTDARDNHIFKGSYDWKIAYFNLYNFGRFFLYTNLNTVPISTWIIFFTNKLYKLLIFFCQNQHCTKWCWTIMLNQKPCV